MTARAGPSVAEVDAADYEYYRADGCGCHRCYEAAWAALNKRAAQCPGQWDRRK